MRHYKYVFAYLYGCDRGTTIACNWGKACNAVYTAEWINSV